MIPTVEHIRLASCQYTVLIRAEYKVNSLPDVPFDVGEMYAGMIPIDMNDKTRALYFVFQPTIDIPVDDITIWLNGGPGMQNAELNSLNLNLMSVQAAVRSKVSFRTMVGLYGGGDNMRQRLISTHGSILPMCCGLSNLLGRDF